MVERGGLALASLLSGANRHDSDRLGGGYLVIEEGLNGRTTQFDDPLEAGRNGLTYLRPCVESHCPLDAVIVMLGTNDLKVRFNLSASDIAESAAGLADYGRRYARSENGAPPRVLLVAPPAVVALTEFDQMFAGHSRNLASSRTFTGRPPVGMICHFSTPGRLSFPARRTASTSRQMNIVSSARRSRTRYDGSSAK